MTRPTLERVERRIGPDEPLPPTPVRPRLGPDDFAAYLAERARTSRLCPVDRISSLDGFLTAILIGPKFLDPRKWIASITGEAALSAPETTREHMAVQAIVAHHNRISAAHSEAPETYRPLFEVDPQGVADPVSWFGGFTRGRDLARRAWAPVDDPTTPEYRLYKAIDDALRPRPLPKNATARVADAVIGLRAFFKDRRYRSRR